MDAPPSVKIARSANRLRKAYARCSSRGSGRFALAQDLGRSLEARILKTVRAKPSEIGILLPQQANHYHIPPNGARFGMGRPSARFELVPLDLMLGPTVLPTLLARGDEMTDW
jgi:hypothetical protein